jgi:hypothetical protein
MENVVSDLRLAPHDLRRLFLSPVISGAPTGIPGNVMPIAAGRWVLV